METRLFTNESLCDPGANEFIERYFGDCIYECVVSI